MSWKYAGLRNRKTLHIFSKISEILMSVKEKLTVLKSFTANPWVRSRNAFNSSRKEPILCERPR